jgi:hypothetical protein
LNSATVNSTLGPRLAGRRWVGVSTLVPLTIFEVLAPTAPIRVIECGAWPPSWHHGWK